MHLSVVDTREAVVTKYFLFVKQEGERIREDSEGIKENASQPVADTNNGLHSGKTSITILYFST